MKSRHLEFNSLLPVSAEEAFAWHERPGTLERLTPPWEQVQIIQRTGSIHNGDRLVLQTRIGPLTQRWTALHEDYQVNRQFCDVQVRGPFSAWRHVHRFEPVGPMQCRLVDQVQYVLPMGRLGDALAGGWTRRKIERLFAYRHRITVGDLAAHHRAGVAPMKVLISGSSGLIGRSLVAYLTAGGHQVTCLVRRQPVSNPWQHKLVVWSPAQGQLDPAVLEGFDAVIHLGGEGIAGRRWSSQQKRRIVDSRIDPTSLLSRTLAVLKRPPGVFICASAIGYYGDRGDEPLDENSRAGRGFLPQTCQAWESACEPARAAGIRVVHARLGLVLSPEGGALAKMLTPFAWGLGGRLGSGRQYWPWICLDDVLDSMLLMLTHRTLSGPVNLAAPESVTNQQFTRILGQVMQRPTKLPAPAWVLRLVMGEMAGSLLLASQRVMPGRLQEAGFLFRYPTLDAALSHLLGRPVR